MAALIAAPAALLLNPGRAEAILTYNIFESGPNVVVQASGSLSIPLNPTNTLSGASGINPFFAELTLATNPFVTYFAYPITGTSSFGNNISTAADSTSGTPILLRGTTASQFFAITGFYLNGDPINATATFNNKTLGDLGITATGLIGTWQLVGIDGDAGRIELRAAAAVPGPLPLFGAAAAFGWSRSLRRRISASGASPNA